MRLILTLCLVFFTNVITYSQTLTEHIKEETKNINYNFPKYIYKNISFVSNAAFEIFQNDKTTKHHNFRMTEHIFIVTDKFMFTDIDDPNMLTFYRTGEIQTLSSISHLRNIFFPAIDAGGLHCTIYIVEDFNSDNNKVQYLIGIQYKDITYYHNCFINTDPNKKPYYINDLTGPNLTSSPNNINLKQIITDSGILSFINKYLK